MSSQLILISQHLYILIVLNLAMTSKTQLENAQCNWTCKWTFKCQQLAKMSTIGNDISKNQTRTSLQIS